MKYAVIAVGYNRPDSMGSLLQSILAAEYYDEEVDLLISIDKGERQNEILEIAEKIKWKHGLKKIHAFKQRQGLRKHIIACGDLTETYEAVIVLEDDLLVSRYFFNYVRQMIRRWGSDQRIAGISLYKHSIHPGVHRIFEAAQNGDDVFLMQFAMSWGQCWTRQMWNTFKCWYLENKELDLSIGNVLPQYILNWNNQSWLKYFMRYIVENNKYFIYPYVALSTNASDAGEHCSIPNNDFQIPIMQGEIDYRIPSFEKAIRYDVFFERVDIASELKRLYGENVILDLYGIRTDYGVNGKYIISCKSLPYKVVREIKLKYRPIEMNCIFPEDGKGFFVYDRNIIDTPPKANMNIITRYDTRSIPWKRLFRLSVSGFKNALLSRIRR